MIPPFQVGLFMTERPMAFNTMENKDAAIDSMPPTYPRGNDMAANSRLIPKLPHHLKTPPWHGTPNDVLVVLVGEVVAAQLDAEFLELFAESDMMQHIRRQVVGKELLFVIRGAAATRHLNGIAQVPGLPLRVEEHIGMVARDVNQLFAIGALGNGFLALIGGDGEDIVARQRDLPILLDKSRIDMVLYAARINLGHVLRHPESKSTVRPFSGKRSGLPPGYQ